MKNTETLFDKKEIAIPKINASDYGLESTRAQEIEAMFKPMIEKMKSLEKEYNDILTLEISPETCQRAKDLRLSYVRVHTGTAAIHKELKAFYLAGGRYVDAWKNTQEFASQEIEKTLKKIEDHFEIIEAERKEKLKAERTALIQPYVEDVNTFMLGEMTENAFQILLSGAKSQYEARIAAEKKAEEDRLAVIEADRKKQEETRLENVRLKEEATERERLAEIERKKQAKILADERAKAETEKKERERLENEIAKKKQKEEEERKTQIAAEKKAARAPDKIKIISLSESIGKIELPEVKSEEAKLILENTKVLLQKIVTYLTEKSETL